MDPGGHAPSALGVLAAAFLIWKYPLSVPRERLPTVIATFVGADVLFVFYLFVRRPRAPRWTLFRRAPAGMLYRVTSLMRGRPLRRSMT
jgi:hypothetical protein